MGQRKLILGRRRKATQGENAAPRKGSERVGGAAAPGKLRAGGGGSKAAPPPRKAAAPSSEQKRLEMARAVVADTRAKARADRVADQLRSLVYVSARRAPHLRGARAARRAHKGAARAHT